MKRPKHILFAISLFVVTGTAQSQIFGNDPEIETDGLSQENVWGMKQVASYTPEINCLPNII